MSFSINKYKKYLPALVAGFVAACTFSAHTTPVFADTVYELDVRVDPGDQSLQGTARILPDFDGPLGLFTRGLVIKNIEGDVSDRNPDSLVFSAQKEKPITIEYELSKDSSVKQMIREDALSLTGVWYPSPEDAMVYKLGSNLPAGFEAVSSANSILKKVAGDRVEHSFIFAEKQEHLQLIASDRFVVKRDRINGVEISTYFYRQDADLADSYLKYSKDYIKRYSEILGRFPYKRFSVVENFVQSGHAMPTFTLLGNRVVRLPFIVKTSLGHEVVHQWLGNHVRTPREGSNWAEGLTTYLSDHLYRRDQGEGGEHRKELLMDYEAYVNEDNEISLSEFVARRDRATSAVGYGKATLVFHMIARQAGELEFRAAVRDFIQAYRGKKADWKDLLAYFDERGVDDPEQFHSEWIEKPGLLNVHIENSLEQCDEVKCTVTFDTVIEGPSIPVSIPALVKTPGENREIILRAKPGRQKHTIHTNGRPDSIMLDPEYELARHLKTEELTPNIARLLNQKEFLIVSEKESAKVDSSDSHSDRSNASSSSASSSIEKTFAHRILHGAELKSITPQELKVTDIKNTSIIFAGKNNSALSPVYGFAEPDPAGGFQISIRQNPWNHDYLAVHIQADNEQQLNRAGRKIFHYGRYSDLVFQNGRNLLKSKFETNAGIPVDAKTAPLVFEDVDDEALDDVAKAIRYQRAVYLGEEHDKHAHHRVQLELIKRMHRLHGDNLIIGMEMFQKPFQQVVDDYARGKLSEEEFLLQSEYFSRWGFDYHLYKPIIDFAKEKNLRIAALNIQRDVIRGVSRHGVHGISSKLKSRLQGPMDFSDKGYRKFLEEVFSAHGMSKMFGDDPERFENFLQSQIIWDESMARVVSDRLRQSQDSVMAVVVGGGHVRFARGIPDRVHRMTGHGGAIILSDEKAVPGIADFILKPDEMEGPALPLLGVKIKQIEQGMHVIGVEDGSVADQAGIQAGDTITGINGRKTKTMDQLKVALFLAERGSETDVTVLRKDRSVELQAVFPREN